MTSAKFRISLSLSQIDWIIANCQADMPELHRQLSLLKAKADLGYTKPAYELQAPRQVKEIPIEIKYKSACRYLDRGEPVPLELMPAYQEYRYLNDLMDEEESAAYEAREGF